jgi:hypothetical protein
MDAQDWCETQLDLTLRTNKGRQPETVEMGAHARARAHTHTHTHAHTRTHTHTHAHTRTHSLRAPTALGGRARGAHTGRGIDQFERGRVGA